MPDPQKKKKFRSFSIAGSPDVRNKEEYAEYRKQQGFDAGKGGDGSGATPLGKKIVAKVKAAFGGREELEEYRGKPIAKRPRPSAAQDATAAQRGTRTEPARTLPKPDVSKLAPAAKQIEKKAGNKYQALRDDLLNGRLRKRGKV